MNNLFIDKNHIAEAFVGLVKWGYLESSKVTAANQKSVLQRSTLVSQENNSLKKVEFTHSIQLEHCSLSELQNIIKTCTDCNLSQARTKAVAGTGPTKPLVMILGDFPGVDEDAIGLPFIGAAGQFLDKWLDSIGLNRYSNAYLSNCVKCYPANEGQVNETHFQACSKYLNAQIALLKPRLIIILGKLASNAILKIDLEMEDMHGKFYQLFDIPCMPMYHPASVLRNPELKRLVWEDLKKIRDKLSSL